jgi:hypothetical protein
MGFGYLAICGGPVGRHSFQGGIRAPLLRAAPEIGSGHAADRLGKAPKDVSIYARTNLWMINTARVEAIDNAKIHAVLVWDEKPTVRWLHRSSGIRHGW